MSIKYLFDDLKILGKKKYISRYNEEEIYFTNKQLQIEIIRYCTTIDLLITYHNQRNHYLDSPCLSYSNKMQIKSVLSSVSSETMKAKTIVEILLQTFA